MSDLPNGWANVELGDVAQPRNERASPDALGELPFVGLEDVESNTGRIISTQNASDLKSSVALFDEGDVLYGRLRPYLNKVVLAPFSGAASAEFIVFPRSDALDQRFLQRILMSPTFVGHTSIVSTGDRPRVSFEAISSFEFSLPPLSEQRRIVTKIDGLAGKSARARNHLDHATSLIKSYKKAILRAAFRGDLTSTWRTQNAISDNSIVTVSISEPFTETFRGPSSWSSVGFNDVCRIEGGSQPPKSTFQYSPGADLIRLIQIRDYKSDDKATYIPKALARRFCTETDIMIGRYGPPNFQILRGLQGAYNVALMKAVPNRDLIEQEFLFWYLQHPSLFEYVDIDAKRTAGQDGVNKAHLMKWPVLLPSLPEQLEIVRRIEAAFAWIDRLASEATSARKLIARLDQAILSKAFRGELVPQDPSDEPASVLLERIRAERTVAKPAKGRRHSS